MLHSPIAKLAQRRHGARSMAGFGADSRDSSLAAAGSIGTHPGSHATFASQAKPGEVTLRRCWLSAAFLPTSAKTLQNAFGSPPMLTQTFYGPEPLVGIWGLACDRARVDDRRINQVIFSLVGAPTGLTANGASPLANNFAHSLLRADTNSRALGKALRRAGQAASVN